MSKNFRTYLIVVAVIMGLLALLEVNKKPLIDWRKTYQLEDKIPFGLYVFNQEAPNIFDGKLQQIKKSPYDYFSKDSLHQPANFLIIEQDIDPESWKKILDQVQKGSDLMWISDHFPVFIRDTLDIGTSFFLFSGGGKISFTDPQRKAEIEMDKLPSELYITGINSKTTEILGTSKPLDSSGSRADFVKVKFGKGNIYLHTEPLFLTNYYLLKKGNEQYAQEVFSYFPNDRPTFWFIPDFANSQQSMSPLRFILANPPLRYAWYIFLIGLLLFIIFTAKRKQRITPIVQPLENTSVDFIRTIGNLYLNEGDVENMAKKKVTYFLNKVRTELNLDTSKLDEDFAEKLKLKTNSSSSDIEKALQAIKKAEAEDKKMTHEELIFLNNILDKIYK